MDGSVGEDDPYKGVRAPHWVGDATATAEVEDIAGALQISFIGFKEN